MSSHCSKVSRLQGGASCKGAFLDGLDGPRSPPSQTSHTSPTSPACHTSGGASAAMTGRHHGDMLGSDGLEACGWAGVFHFVWLDYCGTFGSRAGKKRQRDM